MRQLRNLYQFIVAINTMRLKNEYVLCEHNS